MNSIKTDKGFIIRLTKGEKIIETLSEFSKNQTIYSGVFQGIGAVLDAQLGFYNLDRKEYEFKKIESLHEIVSMNGNISRVDNQPFLHIHIVLASNNLQCIGGHLKEAAVGATCEIYLTPFDTELTRQFDEETGLKLLSKKTD